MADLAGLEVLCSGFEEVRADWPNPACGNGKGIRLIMQRGSNGKSVSSCNKD